LNNVRILDHITFFPFCPPSTDLILFPDLDFHHLLVVSFPLQHNINGKTIDTGFLVQEQTPTVLGSSELCGDWVWKPLNLDFPRGCLVLFTFPISWQRCQLVFSEFLFKSDTGMWDVN